MKTVSATLMAAAALASAVAAGPSFAQDYNHDGYGRGDYGRDHDYYNDPHYASYRYYQDQCGREKHNRNVAGIAAGAVLGGLLGNAVSHGGGRTGGTVIGAAAGAAIGSNVARSTIHCDGGQPYWTYEQTMDYGEYRGYPGRYDNDWYWHHRCRWVRTERGDFIRVCPGRHGYYYPAY
jgi:hypothetical protein